MKQIFISLLLMLGAISPMQAQTAQISINDDEQSVGITVTSDTTSTEYEVVDVDSVVDANLSQAMQSLQSIGITDMDEAHEQITTLGFMTMLVPILGIILGILLPILTLFIIFYFIYKSRKAKYEVIKSAIEHGQPLPPELVSKENAIKGSNSEQQWRKGIKNIFLGLGLTALLGFLCGMEIGSIGILITCIGLGQAFLGYFPTASKLKEKLNKKDAAREDNAAAPQTAVQTEASTEENKTEKDKE